MDAPKVAAGGLLIAVSCFVFAEAGLVTPVPFSTAALGAIGLSAVTLLVGAATA